MIIGSDSSSYAAAIINPFKQAIIDTILPTQPWAKRLQTFTGIILLFDIFDFFCPLGLLGLYMSDKTALLSS